MPDNKPKTNEDNLKRAKAQARAVARMLKTAKETLNRECPKIEDFDGYPYLLAETLKALSFKESEQFELGQMPTKIKYFGKAGA